MGDSDITELKRDLWQSMERFKRLHFGNLLTNGLSYNEFGILGACEESIGNSGEEGIRVSDLVEHMHWSMPATSRLLKSMEEKGYIERQPNPADRRNTIVKRTEKGRELFDGQKKGMDDFITNVIYEMGLSNMQKFLSTQKLMYESMDKVLANMGSKEDPC